MTTYTYVNCPTCRARILADQHCRYCGTYRARVNGKLVTFVLGGRIVGSAVKPLASAIERVERIVGR